MLGQAALPYYAQLIPALIGNVKLAPLLRGKAMETVGLLSEAVGRDRFTADAHKLMRLQAAAVSARQS